MTFRLLQHELLNQLQQPYCVVLRSDVFPVTVFLKLIFKCLGTLAQDQCVHLTTIVDQPLLIFTVRTEYITPLSLLVQG